MDSENLIVNTLREIKNLTEWNHRIQRRIGDLEVKVRLIDHASKTGFIFENKESKQMNLFKA